MVLVFVKQHTERFDININRAGLAQKICRYNYLVGIIGEIDNNGYIYIAICPCATLCIRPVQKHFPHWVQSAYFFIEFAKL